MDAKKLRENFSTSPSPIISELLFSSIEKGLSSHAYNRTRNGCSYYRGYLSGDSADGFYLSEESPIPSKKTYNVAPHELMSFPSYGRTDYFNLYPAEKADIIVAHLTKYLKGKNFSSIIVKKEKHTSYSWNYKREIYCTGFFKKKVRNKYYLVTSEMGTGYAIYVEFHW